MNHTEYGELLSLADALTFISESELLSKILREDGYHPSSFDIEILVKCVAKRIYSNLCE